MNFQVEEIGSTLQPKATEKEQDEVEKQFIDKCYDGMIVLLSREPDNADDDKAAIAAYSPEHDYQRFGYVDRLSRSAVCEFMDSIGTGVAVAEVVNHGRDWILCTTVVEERELMDIEMMVEGKIKERAFGEEVFLNRTEESKLERVLMMDMKRKCCTSTYAEQWEPMMKLFLNMSGGFISAEEVAVRDKMIRRLRKLANKRGADERFKIWHDELLDEHKGLTKKSGCEKPMKMMFERLSTAARQSNNLIERYENIHLRARLKDLGKERLESEKAKIAEWQKENCPMIFKYGQVNFQAIGKGCFEKNYTRRDIYDVLATVVIAQCIESELGKYALPEELATPRAMGFWKRLQEAGYIDSNYQPTESVSGKDKAFIGYCFFNALNSSNYKWSLLQKLWNDTHLSMFYQRLIEKEDLSVYNTKISQIFK